MEINYLLSLYRKWLAEMQAVFIKKIKTFFQNRVDKYGKIVYTLIVS